MSKPLGIAYAVKKKAKKASGGTVESGSPTMNYAKGGPVSAATESRPSTQSTDPSIIAQAHAKKALVDSSWSARPDKEQTKERKKGIQPIAHPSMPKGATFKVRRSDMQDMLMDQEDNQQDSFAPGAPAAQPKQAYDEKGANRQGPVPPAQKMFAEGGSVEHERDIMEAASLAAAIMARRKMARGGEILSEDSMETSSSEMSDLNRNAEEDANMEDKASFDALRKENYSESSALDEANHPEDSNMIEPEHEEMDVHDDSIVSAIRNKMKKKSPIAR